MKGALVGCVAVVLCGRLAAQEQANPAAENAKFVAAIKLQIAGKEKSPAKDVFKNLKTLGDGPADRVLAVMEQGYARSLGVSCTHCHNPENWSSDEKSAKQIARDMTALSRSLRDQLKAIEGLGNRNPVVNCTTCHRGALKPATNLS